MGKTAEFLLVVEDSDEDFYALMRALNKVCSPTKVMRCTDGDEALEFIFDREGLRQPLDCLPRAILLDLNLPGTDGRFVLEQIKQDSFSKQIPVVIFSTSSNPRDINFCYRNGANGYLIKPINVEELQRLVKAFVDYWLNSNTPPTATSNLDLFPISNN
ncbi:MAG: response regulator [Synechococcus sp.]